MKAWRKVSSTGQPAYQTFLIQIYPCKASESEKSQYPILPNQTTIVGRDPILCNMVVGSDPSLCNIFLDSTQYLQEVSRRHLQISPLESQPSNGTPAWTICDLKSSNGTYVNGQRLQGCQALQAHDRIKLGKKGPEFIFECQEVSVSNIGLSDVSPIFSKKLALHQQSVLVPGLVTVIFVVAMLATQNSNSFLFVLAAYLALASHYVIHQLCHKHKPLWLLISLGLATSLPLLTDFHHFTDIGDLLQKQENFLATIIKAFFKAGLFEELFKALPVLFVYWLGRLLQSPKRELIGVWEPMDGILLGTASATGFALVETFMLVNEQIHMNNTLAALQLLIPLILGDIFGQVAYSGYFGYFIGLSALRPRKRWQFLGIGYLTSAVIHTLWYLVYELQKEHKLLPLIDSLLLALIGSLAYIFLIAAILKARQLSPSQHGS